MYQHILVITDQDNFATLSLDKANIVAQQFRATVEVISIIDASKSNIDVAAHTQALNDKVQDRFDDSITVHTHVIDTDNMCRWINQYCEHHPIDLVIKTGHRTEKLFYTPSDWQLMRELTCSVLILSDEKWRAKRRLLATVDANKPTAQQSAMNQKVLQQTKAWADSEDFDMHCAYVQPLPTVKIELDIVEQEQYEREHGQQALASLEQLLTEYNFDSYENHIGFGAAHKRIPSIANKIKADLVVVGSLGRKGVSAVVIGNTAEKILHHLRTDILVVKP